ncbi:sirohydrochlorin chelatase [Niallia endozanthoxylica]|uniref:Sirohydrochlorin chelatase n=1 Tax=Niallia endozanthoxylica TaxID=2036016 RepID=A0A5J5HM08_9BACI|nr:sirohydrochlorin chelatase [Niallia endozanthoxylica]KAA9021805.1 sirohydrochlorin chelatase [Niallia endozanthoxylica]
MNAVLFICHGSRVRQAADEAIAFIQKVMQKVNLPIQEIGFLELAEPSLEQGFERCVEQGATTIFAVPILLLTAAHAKEDIPSELRSLQARFPEIDVRLGSPIGVHEKMIEILMERIAETSVPIKENAMVLLVGRGSSDPDVKRDLTMIGRMLEKKSNIKRVEVCFLSAAEPSFEQGLERTKQAAPEQVFVIPYLFFTGILMKKIEKMINQNKAGQGPDYVLCEYLGYHSIIEDILHEKIMDLQYEKNSNHTI